MTLRAPAGLHVVWPNMTPVHAFFEKHCHRCHGKDGEQEEWLARGMTEIDGALPVNTDGGCLANGEPIGASGLRQVYEVVTQLRGTAGERQVPGHPCLGFTHVYGAPGLSACTVLTA